MGIIKKNIIFFIISIIFGNNEITDLYNNGINEYKNENYSNAIQFFNMILDIEYESEELYYNLGNSYYLKNNIPMSIWSYEKCLKLNPLNKDAQFNLKLSNLNVKDRIEIPKAPLLLKLFRLLKTLLLPSEWILLWMISLLAISFLYSIRKIFFIDFIKNIEFIIISILIILIFPGIFSIYDSYIINEGIIISSKIEVYSAPNTSSTELFNIHSGLKVDIEDFENNWIRIKLIDGKEGWIQSNQILEI